MTAQRCLNIWIVDVYLEEACLEAGTKTVIKTLFLVSSLAHQRQMIAYESKSQLTLGNSLLIFAYSGAINLHGPHHFAVKSSTDSLSAVIAKSVSKRQGCCLDRHS